MLEPAHQLVSIPFFSGTDVLNYYYVPAHLDCGGIGTMATGIRAWPREIRPGGDSGPHRSQRGTISDHGKPRDSGSARGGVSGSEARRLERHGQAPIGATARGSTPDSAGSRGQPRDAA